MSEPRTHPMPVRAVTAYEDRAELTRRETLDLPPGRHRIRVPDITPLAGDAHQTARIEAGPATVEHLRTVRRRVTDPDRVTRRLAERDAARLEATTAADAARLARDRRDAARLRLARYLHDTDRALRAALPPTLAAAFTAPAAAPAALGAAPPETTAPTPLAAAITRLEARLDAADATLRDALARERHTTQNLIRLERLATTTDPIRTVCDLEIQLLVDAAAPITLLITQIIPCALWRPAHTAHLTTNPTTTTPAPQITWTALGTVWQHTGEDWTAIDLTLSTARPAAGAHLPHLTADRLTARPRADKKRVVVAHREEAIATDKGDTALPGVDDGGETRTYRASAPVDIPADGRPHRVELGRFTTDATLAHVTRPALAATVFELAHLTNTASWPLLAGPVELRRDGAFTGTGDLTYTGPGERFELAFGSDDRYTIRHRRHRRTQKRTIGRDRTIFVTDIEVIYTGTGQGDLTIQLQMPISELADLQIIPADEHCSEGRPRPDPDGIVHLPITCRPGQPRPVQLGFRFEHGADVVMPDPW